MANNRMWLVHRGSGQKVLLAKYYPTTGWYVFHDDLGERMNELFDRHDFGHLSQEQLAANAAAPGFTTQHKSVGGMWGDTNWLIEYETEDDE